MTGLLQGSKTVGRFETQISDHGNQRRIPWEIDDWSFHDIMGRRERVENQRLEGSCCFDVKFRGFKEVKSVINDWSHERTH